MAISLKSALVLGGSFGLAYAASPRFRKAVDPTIKKATDAVKRVREGAKEVPAKAMDAAQTGFKPIEDGMDDVKSILQSLAKRISAVEEDVKNRSGKTNEYRGELYIQ